MKKTTLFKMMFFSILVTFCTNANSQASLPFSYDSGNPGTSVTGLTASGLGSNYSSSPKMKFDDASDNLVLNFNSNPGILSYKVKGNPSSGTTTSGTFEIYESNDNSSYTLLRSILNKDNISTTYTDNPKATTRYIKWVYTSKTSGNIGLGAITLALGVSAATNPTFTPVAGTYTSTQNVTISNGSSTDKIYYTLDGSDPTSTSSLYSGAISISSTTTVKAIAYDQNNANPSSIITATYTIVSPTITVTETSIPLLNGTVGETASTIIHVAATQLVGDISFIFSGANAGLFSTDPVTLSPVSGTVTSTEVSVKYTPIASGTQTTTLTVSSPSAMPVIFSVTGKAISTGVKNTATEQLKVYVTNDKVMFRATAGESVKIFNSIGQVILNKEATEGLNEISVTNKGLHIIKVGNKTSKIIL